jgi:hypothetical protein
MPIPGKRQSDTRNAKPTASAPRGLLSIADIYWMMPQSVLHKTHLNGRGASKTFRRQRQGYYMYTPVRKIMIMQNRRWSRRCFAAAAAQDRPAERQSAPQVLLLPRTDVSMINMLQHAARPGSEREQATAA